MELFEFILLIIERVFWSDGILYLFRVPTLRIPYKTRIPSMYRFPMTDWYFLRNARANNVILKNPKIVHNIGMHFIDIRFISLRTSYRLHHAISKIKEKE